LKRKYLVVGLLAFCLVAPLFIGVTSSGTTPSVTAATPYDPWYDVNDDGDINIIDIVAIGIRFDTSGTPINKGAIAYNSTAVFYNSITTSTMWVDMEGTSLTITLVRASDLLIMFSSEAMTNSSDGRILVRAIVDGGIATPEECYFTPIVSAAGDGHSHTLDYKACAFNFLYYSAGAGTHTVKIQWHVMYYTYPTTGSVYFRTLAVLGVNQ